MSWLGNGFREEAQSMADAYQKILDENRRAARAAGGYKDDSKKQTDPSKDGFTGISGSIKEIMKQNKEIEAKNKMKKEDIEPVDIIEDSYSVSIEDGFALEEGKKKCKDGYEWDSDEGKCVKKKKSSKTTIIIGRGYGGHSHDDDKDDDNDGGNETGGGGDAGGGDGGGGGE